MVAAAALRVVGADPGFVGRHASLQSHPAWPRPVRLHHRHRADRAGVRVLLAAGRRQHPAPRCRGGGHPAGLRNAGRRRRVLAAQRRRLVRRPPRAAYHPAAAERTRSAPSRHRHRGTPPWPAGVPGRRADVADLRRTVLGGHRRRCGAEAAGRRHRRTSRTRARRGGRRDGSRVAVGAAASSRRGRSPSGSTQGERTHRTGPARSSLGLAGCASPRRIRTANGSSRSRSSIASSRSPRVGRSKRPNFPNSPDAALRRAAG